MIPFHIAVASFHLSTKNKIPMKTSIHCRLLVFTLALFVVLAAHATPAQVRRQVEEPPIPVVLGSPTDSNHITDEKSIALSVSDFNHVMEREDSLRRSFSEETLRIRMESEKKSLFLYALCFLLVVSNFFSFTLGRRDRLRKAV